MSFVLFDRELAIGMIYILYLTLTLTPIKPHTFAGVKQTFSDL